MKWFLRLFLAIGVAIFALGVVDGFSDLGESPAVPMVVGCGFIALALLFLHRTRGLSRADADWLRRHGRLLKGRSPRVIPDEMIRVLGRSPFRVDVDVHDPVGDEVRVLSSPYMWSDPSPFITGQEILDVYIDPARPERYLVDLSSLPRTRPGLAER